MEDNFFPQTRAGGGWFGDDSSALCLLCSIFLLLLHQLHLGSSGIRLQKLGTPALNLRRRQWHPTPVLLPGKSHGRRRLVAAVHGVVESWTRLSDFTFHFHALEKEMATHSSVLAWRMPGTAEPDGLLSMGSHRVRHD